MLQRDPPYLAISHRIVLQTKFAVGEHKLGIILLCPLDPPWRIDKNDLKFANFLRKTVPIEVLHIAVDETVRVCLFQSLLAPVE